MSLPERVLPRLLAMWEILRFNQGQNPIITSSQKDGIPLPTGRFLLCGVSFCYLSLLQRDSSTRFQGPDASHPPSLLPTAATPHSKEPFSVHVDESLSFSWRPTSSYFQGPLWWLMTQLTSCTRELAPESRVLVSKDLAFVSRWISISGKWKSRKRRNEGRTH